MKKQSFTLIELLVVIGIIGILLGILLPAISSTMREGKRTKSAADCRSIALACQAYRADYGTNASNAATELNFNDIRVMFKAVTKAEAQAGNANNPRNKEYFASVKDLANPWGSPYYVKFDTDYNGEIETSFGSYAGSVVVYTIDKSGLLISSGLE